MPDKAMKKLSDLRVVDLRAELEKRGLDKNGVKNVLIQRLTEALEEEGYDPESYTFEEETENTIQNEEQENMDESLEEKQEEAEKKEPAKKEATKNQPKDKKPEEKTECSTKKDDDDDLRLTLDDDETLQEDLTESDVKTKEKAQEKTEKTDDVIKNKEDNKKPIKTTPNIIWVSNVAKKTRATELKDALSKQGKVVSAKVVVNARFPGSNCFGYVTMATPEDAQNVIEKLTNTELNGQIITIQRFDEVRQEQLNKVKEDREKKPISKSASSNDTSRPGKKTEFERDEPSFYRRPFERSLRGRGRSGIPPRRGGRPDRRPYPPRESEEGLTFSKIKEKVELQKQRERERLLREETRRRQEEEARQREIERRQKSEAARLEREKQKLMAEKEKIERERAELIRLEKERQRLEREKIAREKAELQSTLQRMEEDRRAGKRPHSFREEGYDRKKPHHEGGQRYETYARPKSPPPQKEYRNSSKGSYSGGEYRHSSKGDYSSSSRSYDRPGGSSSSRKYEKPYEMSSRRSDNNPPEPTEKYSRYSDKERDSRSSSHYKSTPKDSYKPPASTSTPYSSSSNKLYSGDHKPYGGGSYPDSRGDGALWNSTSTPKAYMSSNYPSGNSSKPWEKPGSDWTKFSSGASALGGPSLYSSSGSKSYAPEARYGSTYTKSTSSAYKKY